MKYYTTYRENGNIIETFDSIEDAVNAIHEYEIEDNENGDLTPDFYDIVDENNISYGYTPKAILCRAQNFITDRKCLLLLYLIRMSSYIDSINQDKDAQKNRLELIVLSENFKKKLEDTDELLNRSLLMAENWKQECSSDDLEKAEYYIDEFKKSKEDLISYNQEFNNKLTQAEIKGIVTSQNFTNPSSPHPKNKVLRYGLEKIRNLAKSFCPIKIKITKNNV